jgi:hypothetical protein
MFRAVAVRVDRRIANAILVRARRRWPVLRIVPAALIRPLIAPATTLLRRELSRRTATAVGVLGGLTLLLLLVGAL